MTCSVGRVGVRSVILRVQQYIIITSIYTAYNNIALCLLLLSSYHLTSFIKCLKIIALDNTPEVTVATVWCCSVLIYYPVKHQSNVTLFALLSSSNKLLPANGQQQEVPRRETVGYIIQSY